MDGNFCVENVCKCENGFSEKGKECFSHQSSICGSCFDGYILNSLNEDSTTCKLTTEYCENGKSLVDKECVFNQCTCKNGNGVVGVDCPEHLGQTKCQTCEPGFHLVGLFCEENVCKCENGIAEEGRECLSDSTHICGSCFEGFVLSSTDENTTVCVNAVQCSCLNGNGAIGNACLEHQSLQCQSCDPGFHLDGQFCVCNVCICENGLAEVGRKCSTDASHICGSCFDGFTVSSVDENSTTCKLINEYCESGKSLVGGECVVNQCSCEDGKGAVGVDCPEHQGQTKCQSCEPGFHLDGLFCVENVCKCENGMAEIGRECLTHNTQICGSCFDGYLQKSVDQESTTCRLFEEYCDSGKTLVNDECVFNQCTCKNGNGAEGSDCPEHRGQTKCTTCEPGFHLVGFFCEETVCKCEHGMAKVGRECLTNSVQICGS